MTSDDTDVCMAVCLLRVRGLLTRHAVNLTTSTAVSIKRLINLHIRFVLTNLTTNQ